MDWSRRGGRRGGGEGTWQNSGRRNNGRNERNGNNNHGHQPCHHFQRGACARGRSCRFSHDISSNRTTSRSSPSAEESFMDDLHRDQYKTWKRMIKRPPVLLDLHSVERIWKDALDILNESNRDWRQMLPRDLADNENAGKDHINVIMSMDSSSGRSATLVRLARYFLLVITHPAILDCLSVDTFVGGLYNFISGYNGRRAIPFFRTVCENVIKTFAAESISKDEASETLASVAIALYEVVKREQDVAFNENIDDLLQTIANAPAVVGIDINSVSYPIIMQRLGESVAVVDRAKGRLKVEETSQYINMTVAKSTFPKAIITPGGQHSNDHPDITRITIIPTEDEVWSDAAEYLPTTDYDEPSFLRDLAERHLDTHFRLLRQDIFGEMKEALAALIHSIIENPKLLNNPRISLGNMRAHCYTQAHVTYLSIDPKRGGIDCQVTFNPPTHLHQKSTAERRRWWDEAKRLDEGVLLCFVCLNGDEACSLLFLEVSEKVTDAKATHGLVSDKRRSAIIHTKLANTNERNLKLLMNFSCQQTKGVLVEFPGIVVSTFIPILENLQHMQKVGHMPFRDWILPQPTGSVSPMDMPPPLYARGQNFTFSLDCILKDKSTPLSVNPRTAASDPEVVKDIEARTTLDHGQASALLAALTREYTFIQGPPGTGKSYVGVNLMRVLLACKDQATLGPIIVICYTNHALDQFLEHLITEGIEKVIRIGGQSKSEVLEGKNLRLVSQSEGKTKSEKYLLAMAYESLEDSKSSIERLLNSLRASSKGPVWHRLHKHVLTNYPEIHKQFRKVDDEGYEMSGDPFEMWWGRTDSPRVTANGSNASEDEVIVDIASLNIHCLTSVQRQRLVAMWTEEYQEEIIDLLEGLVAEVQKKRRQITDIHDEVDRRVLNTADVIGVTTTGLAKRISVLRCLRSKIIMCEEAGEVLEAHMLSALLPGVQHFIQIGDHEQLRPQINNYALSMESKNGAPYQLDRSQFERLLVSRSKQSPFPVAQLNIQRRMRPEISTLIRETLYPALQDHSLTTTPRDVVGLRHNVFWLDHNNFEEGKSDEKNHKSHSNSWEVDMTHALVRHVIRQGAYKSSDIAVLTPYTGQLQKLRAKLRDDFEIVLSERDEDVLARDGFADSAPDSPAESSANATALGMKRQKQLSKKKLTDMLRLATVDNFQGEEAKVVIVSLVRSNNTNKVGFLRTTNRINVLLSRAKDGLYLIGNATTYGNIPMWAKVLGMLGATESVGQSLFLCCPRHAHTLLQVTEPIDFQKVSPEGGCQLPCNQRLQDCGHMCLSRCHSKGMHAVYKCPQPCERLHSPCNHSCQKTTCGEDCGPCLLTVNNVSLPCLHFKNGIHCYRTLQLDTIKCDTLVSKTIPQCRHEVIVKCFQDVTSETFSCPTPCGTNLECGHLCPGTCGTCNKRNVLGEIMHQSCKKTCGRSFGACNHTCPQKCHSGTNCSLCQSACEVQCAHSKCTLKCHDACTPCIEQCTWSCEHVERCTMPCGAPCDRLPCNKRCSKLLQCGHQCPSICGEVCPEGYCKQCGDKLDSRVDFIELKTYGETDIDETPIIVLGCGHFFCAESIDHMMGMSDVYEMDDHGEIVALAKTPGALAERGPACPDCKHPVRQHAVQRYNRVVNRAVMDEIYKRFLTSRKEELAAFESEISNVEEELQGSLGVMVGQGATPSQEDAMKTLQRLRIKRYKHLEDILANLGRFLASVDEKHLPARKLFEATVASARRAARARGDIVELTTNLDLTATKVPQFDARITLAAHVVRARAEALLLSDTLITLSTLRTVIRFGPKEVSFIQKNLTKFTETRKPLIQDCYDNKLPKLAVEAALAYATLAYSTTSFAGIHETIRGMSVTFGDDARKFLQTALFTCNTTQFRNAENLARVVERYQALLEKERYEPVTAEELKAIMDAMVSGRGGIATHSGHWYNCENGHPFAIGECGMPMQLAKCPECGAPIGGRNHEIVPGVTRAMDMER